MGETPQVIPTWVTALAGRNVAFAVNALSFFASAFFIARTRYDATPAPAPS